MFRFAVATENKYICLSHTINTDFTECLSSEAQNPVCQSLDLN